MANIKLNSRVYEGTDFVDLPSSVSENREFFINEEIFKQMISGNMVDTFTINQNNIEYLKSISTGSDKVKYRAKNILNILVPLEDYVEVNYMVTSSTSTEVYIDGEIVDNNYTLELNEVENGLTIKGSVFSYFKEGKLILPDNITSIGFAAFANNMNLREIVFKGDVSTIGGSAFNLPSSFFTFDRIYNFSNATFVPSLSASNALPVANNSIIIVPDSLYNDWIVATNWAALADHIKKASEVNN